ncbi:MAG: methanogenesis marker 1 protein [Methanomicrobiales archaeon]|nr:methanogenesis marker 1 protein [Methanomicrobiales archaeon]
MNPVRLRHVPKHFFEGTHRASDPETVCNNVRPLMAEIGVTGVEDLTGYDRLGIPVVAAHRPAAARGGSSIHAGKGLTRPAAEAAAMMAAVERFSAEYRHQQLEYAAYEELGLTRAVDPADLILPRDLEIGEKLQWVPSWDLLNEEEVAMPANAVYHPYNPVGMAQQLFRSDSYGLAAGSCIEEAVLHGMLEVVELDAMSTAERSRHLGSRITVDRDSPAGRMLERFTGEGIDIHLWLLPGKTGIPAVAAAADDTVARDPALVVVGSAAHTDPETAVIRALTEVARNRAGYLHGRPDIVRETVGRQAGYERLKRINRIWYRSSPETSLADIPGCATDAVDTDVGACIERITPHTDRICIVDLTLTAVPVVRVIIPGFAVSYADISRIPRTPADRLY